VHQNFEERSIAHESIENDSDDANMEHLKRQELDGDKWTEAESLGDWRIADVKSRPIKTCWSSCRLMNNMKHS
jgi:hypothetical protein